MKRYRVWLAAAALALALAGARRAAAEESFPLLKNAHAHNDYEHSRPLLDALDQGFCSVEADIYLVDGQLLVAHERRQVSPERTLQKLYLDPLRERVRKNSGHVYPEAAPFTLLIDVKTEAKSTWIALEAVLRGYADMLAEYRPGGDKPGAVSVVVSGSRDRDALLAAAPRLAGYDGRLADLEGDAAKAPMPWVSESWRPTFKWNGVGEFPQDQREKLAGILAKAHAQGRRVRFWATPDTPAMWGALLDAGVDYVNTDDLAGLRKFVLGRAGQAGAQATAPASAPPRK